MYDKKIPKKIVSLIDNTTFVGGVLNRETKIIKITLSTPNKENMNKNKKMLLTSNIIIFFLFLRFLL